MKNYEIVCLIDNFGNVSFEKIRKECLEQYLQDKEFIGYKPVVINKDCFYMFEDFDHIELRFDLYDADVKC